MLTRKATYFHSFSSASSFILLLCLFCTQSGFSRSMAFVGATECDISEYECDDGDCVTVSHFCDGVAHCRDYSDEPPGCSVCNRTFYGYTDRTYSIEVPSAPAMRSHSRGALGYPSSFPEGRSETAGEWPARLETTDFICILTFSAVGRNHGDIIQVTFDHFHVGHYNVTGAQGGGKDGCSGDHIIIEEPKSVPRGGRWCGEGTGLNVYFSETDTIVITLKATTATFGEYFDNPLRFKLKYRFLKKETAIVRYGSFQEIKFRGELVRNTACSRVFQGCKSRSCKIQSPNFPGFYPRNITCYYLIKAFPVSSPDSMAVIALSQENDRMLQIGQREHSSRVSPESILKQDHECVDPEDYVLVYDGGAMRFPLLSKFCGTAKLTNITSSGPEMLVVFKSAASGKMNHIANLATGFELDVQVHIIKKNPNSVHTEECEEVIKSFGATSGVIYSPVYALPSNSSCRYIFNGRRDEIVWLYFTKYNRDNDESRMPFGDVNCKNRLTIHDGNLDNSSLSNETNLLGEFCDEQIPPLCIRSKEKGFVAKPCTREESFLSSTPNVIIKQEFTDPTSIKSLEYIIHYEFVNIQETGLSLFNSSCDLNLDSSSGRKGLITAPRSIFYYGRGGRKNLLCKYKFNTKPNEAVKLTILSINFPDRMCKTSYNKEKEVYDCIARVTGTAILEVFETYWNNTKLILGCICDNRLKQVNLISYSDYMELYFIIKQMTWSQDYKDFSFEAEYEFIPVKNCSEQKIYNGTNGFLHVNSFKENEQCNQMPWKISAKHTHHIYLNIPGIYAPNQRCQTTNRIVIYDSDSGMPIKSVCPSIYGEENVSVFSSGWSSHLELPRGEPVNMIFKFLTREDGAYKLKWLEVKREPRPSALESSQGGGLKDKDRPFSNCGTECPEISACISEDLWCDGFPHCPSGADEDKRCFYATVPWMYVVLITVSLLGLIFGSIVILIAVKVYQKGKIKRKKKKEAQRLMTQEVLLPMTYHKDNIQNIYLRSGGI